MPSVTPSDSYTRLKIIQKNKVHLSVFIEGWGERALTVVIQDLNRMNRHKKSHREGWL